MTNSKRHAIFFFLLLLVGVAFLLRLFYLQVIKHDFFVEKSSNQLTRVIAINPNRGLILDRDLEPLALTEPAYDVFALPKEIENKREYTTLVAPLLGLERRELAEKLNRTRQSFIWIRRQISEERKVALEKLELKGIGFISREKRVYPNKHLAAPVLGYVGIDNQGLSGMEYYFDSLLKGSSGKIIIDGDPRGNRLISGQMKQIQAKHGGVIVTTIDKRLQFFAEFYLGEAVSKYQAKHGQVIIMEPETGDILAMAIVPTYNANNWQNSQVNQRKIIPISNMFEPGSIFKLIILAAALEENIVSVGSKLHVPEQYKLYNRTITEAHDREAGDSGVKSVTEIIEQSLNVGTSLLALKLGEERFYNYMQGFGFGKKTGIELNGEASGMLRPLKSWSGVDIAMMSFGQGIAVTGLQMTAAAATIANGGVYVKPRIVQYIAEKESINRQAIPILRGHRVISEDTATKVLQVMQNVVERGTGTGLGVKGYLIGGKTGTAQKAREDGRGYAAGEYIASFVGFVPVDKPKVVIFVSIDTPIGGYYGSTVAGPVFKKLAEQVIDIYNIPPVAMTDTQTSTANSQGL